MAYTQSGSDTYHMLPTGITYTAKQTQAMKWPLDDFSGSLTFSDSEVLKDTSGDTRLSFTDDGSLVLYDESGNAGITLNTDLGTKFESHITASGNISASGGNVILSLPTSDPAVTGSLFTTGSTSMGIGAITGSGKFLILCVSNG